MTTLRIALAEPRPGRLANGGFQTRGHLVVLADDTGHRAVPIWLRGAGDLSRLLERSAGQVITAAVPQELTTRRGSPRTPTSSGSASSWPAQAGSSCATRS